MTCDYCKGLSHIPESMRKFPLLRWKPYWASADYPSATIEEFTTSICPGDVCQLMNLMPLIDAVQNPAPPFEGEVPVWER